MNHEIVTFDVEAPSNMDMLLGMVSKTADENTSAWIQPLTVRMPVILATTLDALAKYSGQSRNKLAVKALESAMDTLWEQLPEADRTEIEAIRAELIADRLQSATGESGVL